MRTPLILLLIMLAFVANAQLTLSGIVFHDTNGNGERDSGEPGVAGVAVSDQASVVATDKEGHYTIPDLRGFGLVMISVPTGYAASTYWKSSANASSSIDFPLKKIAVQTEFVFVHASDTHVSEKSLDRMAKFKAAVERANPALVVVTGDLIRDALRVSEAEATRLYELYKSETAGIKPPVWNAPGNHEIFGIERHLSLVSANHPLYGRKMYRHFLGPDYYSFNYGGVHFIALNSLEYDDLWYYGRIDSLQLEWLKQDVAQVARTTPIVTFQHVPLYSGGISLTVYEPDGPGRTLEKGKGGTQLRHVVSNSQEIFSILKEHNYPLALAGHHHSQQKFSLEGVQTRFEQTAAVIGPSEEGVFKLPSGITVYRVKNGAIDAGTFVRLD
jgi:predicted MPP superfamily phosphohydrolase